MSALIREEGVDRRHAAERAELLRRWVHQPPANPYMQYLRDAERLAALDQLEGRMSVLDLASEMNVTTGISAESVKRLDFSPTASDYAAELLEDLVDEYAVTDPEWPRLPFDDSVFDAAVSIGPFDWKFLDVDRLLEELHRVIRDDGLLVFSVPTPRSPYSTADSYRFRYLTPDEAQRFIPTNWRLVDVDILFQYPDPLHTVVNKLPDRFQKPFVEIAWKTSDQLTSHELWDYASYLVFGIAPLDYESSLRSGLECLFRPTEDNGFWDSEEQKIIRALEYSFENGRPVWQPVDQVKWRYAPFALMGVMRWRSSELGNDRYDDKIQRELEYFTEQIQNPSTLAEMPSYGIGPLIMGFAVAADQFEEPTYASAARQLYAYSSSRFEFTHAEDSLLLFGWSHLYEYSGNEVVLADIADALWTVNERLAPEGLFQFENPTSHRHQNQMYTLWGLSKAVEVTNTPGYLDSAERVLDYTVENRMRDDGAFLWDEPASYRKVKRGVHKRLGGRPPHWDFLYECHQTFFVNAVLSYYEAGGSRNYDREVREAMSWIYGNNELGTNLIDLSGLGVPMRQMTVGTRMDVPGQMYKGAYEIGSYLMALTELVTN